MTEQTVVEPNILTEQNIVENEYQTMFNITIRHFCMGITPEYIIYNLKYYPQCGNYVFDILRVSNSLSTAYKIFIFDTIYDFNYEQILTTGKRCLKFTIIGLWKSKDVRYSFETNERFSEEYVYQMHKCFSDILRKTCLGCEISETEYSVLK